MAALMALMPARHCDRSSAAAELAVCSRNAAAASQIRLRICNLLLAPKQQLLEQRSLSRRDAVGQHAGDGLDLVARVLRQAGADRTAGIERRAAHQHLG